MREEDRQQSRGFWDALFAGLGKAIADIRHKVVEEGWFGRAVTRDPRQDRDNFYRPVLPQRPSFEETWAPRTREEASPSEERAERGLDIDR